MPSESWCCEHGQVKDGADPTQQVDNDSLLGWVEPDKQDQRNA